LITPSERACLADFGLAIPTDSGSVITMNNSTPKTRGTVRWQAPELLGSTIDETGHHHLNNKATDMYAFACLCYEVSHFRSLAHCRFLSRLKIFSGNVPFYRIRNLWTVRDKVKKGQRPIRPSDELSKVRGLTDEVWDLVEICWSSDPTQRLTAADIVVRLRALPNQPMDRRPVDDFGADFPSRALYKHPEHAFCVLDLPPFSPMNNGDVGGNAQCEYRNFVRWPFPF
jgi:serine/threonine protein kinase